MSAYDLEEQEKIAELKAWWKRYGGLVVTTLVLGLLVVAGVRYWSHYKLNQAQEAASAYGELLKAVEAKDQKKVRDVSGTLIEQYPRTIYAPLGAFVSAKQHVESGDLKTARAQLQWVVDKAKDDQIEALGRVRLAHVLLDEKENEAAVKLLEAKHPDSFSGAFADLRGDAYTALGNKAEARKAYTLALEKISKDERVTRDLVQMKLDALGEA